MGFIVWGKRCLDGLTGGFRNECRKQKTGSRGAAKRAPEKAAAVSDTPHRSIDYFGASFDFDYCGNPRMQ